MLFLFLRCAAVSAESYVETERMKKLFAESWAGPLAVAMHKAGCLSHARL
jgi:hypothetical protein